MTRTASDISCEQYRVGQPHDRWSVDDHDVMIFGKPIQHFLYMPRRKEDQRAGIYGPRAHDAKAAILALLDGLFNVSRSCEQIGQAGSGWLAN